MLRVAVIEDDPRYRATLETFFGHAPGFALAASFGAAEPALVLASRETPRAGVTSHAGKPLPTHGSRVRILTYNIAKAFLHKGGLAFESPETVRARLARIAAVISAEQPDMVFLQEAVFECSLCPVNQVVTLAEATGMRFWVLGENYNVGVPFVR